MSAEKGQEGFLAGFQDSWAVHVLQAEQQDDKLGKYGPAAGGQGADAQLSKLAPSCWNMDGELQQSLAAPEQEGTWMFSDLFSFGSKE